MANSGKQAAFISCWWGKRGVHGNACSHSKSCSLSVFMISFDLFHNPKVDPIISHPVSFFTRYSCWKNAFASMWQVTHFWSQMVLDLYWIFLAWGRNCFLANSKNSIWRIFFAYYDAGRNACGICKNFHFFFQVYYIENSFCKSIFSCKASLRSTSWIINSVTIYTCPKTVVGPEHQIEIWKEKRSGVNGLVQEHSRISHTSI